MSFAPFHPDGNQQGLKDPCDRRSEECSHDPKEFGPSDERGERDNRMEANGLPNDARPYHIALNHMNYDEVDQHDNGDNPPLGQGKEDTDCTIR